MNIFFKSNTPPASLRQARIAPLSGGVFVLLLIAACGAQDEGTSEQKSAILYGEKSPASDSSTLALRTLVRNTDTPDYTKPSADTGMVFCTAVLIAPNLAMTARHCVAYLHQAPQGGGGIVCSAAGVLEGDKDLGRFPRLANVKMDRTVSNEEVQVGACPDGFGSCDPSLKRYVVDIAVPQTTEGDSASICRDDLALLKLETPFLPEQSNPAPIRFDVRLAEGDVLRSVGFGNTQSSDLTGGISRHRKDVKVLAVGPAADIADSYPAPVRTFANDGPSQCPGDSGGPTFSSKGAVVGIYSRFTGGDCKSPSVRNISTQVAHHRRFIETTATAWGMTIAPEEYDGGEACTVDEFCKSRSCVAGKCAVPCDAKGGCAAGFECKVKACTAKAVVPPPAATGGEGSGICAVQSPGHGSSPDRSSTKLAAAFLACAFVVGARRRARTNRAQRF